MYDGGIQVSLFNGPDLSCIHDVGTHVFATFDEGEVIKGKVSRKPSHKNATYDNKLATNGDIMKFNQNSVWGDQDATYQTDHVPWDSPSPSDASDLI